MARPRQPLLSRSLIVATALSLVDSAGLEAVSVRRLAGALGVAAPSLYNYFRTKADIVDAVADAVVSEVDLSVFSAYEWPEALRLWAHSYHAVLSAHPNIVPVLASGPGRRPASLAMADAVYGSLIAGGWPPARATHIGALMRYLITGSALGSFALGFDNDPQVYASDYPNLHHAHRLAGHRAEVDEGAFALGLETLINGLHALLPGKELYDDRHPPGNHPVTVQALVVRGPGQEPTLADITLPTPGPGRVKVRIRAAGVCHSDLAMLDGTLTPAFPLVLGHEAAGDIIEVGTGVTGVAPGDHVALNWSPPCGHCWFCTHSEPWLCEAASAPARENGATLDGEPLHMTLGLGAFAEEVVVPARAVVGVPAKLGWEDAALLGCAVLTGAGAVRNTAGVRAGQSVVVFGLGGVGLSVVAAARAAGAAPVIAVDVSSGKEPLATAAGATDFLISDDGISRGVRALTGWRGADHAFECVGRAATIRSAWRATRRGGTVTVVGIGRADDMLSLSALEIFVSARTLRSCVYGSSVPEREVPQLADHVLDGTLHLDHLITDRIALPDIPAAFTRMRNGEGARSIVVLS